MANALHTEIHAAIQNLPNTSQQRPVNLPSAPQCAPSLLLGVRNRIVPGDFLNIRDFKEIGRVGAADAQLPGAAFAVLLAAFQAVFSGRLRVFTAREQVSITDAFMEEGKPEGDVV